MSELTITHCDAEGTLIEGTSRNDGTAQILKANGWRWSRNLSSWFVPRSRDKAPKGWVIEATAAALTAAGFVVQTRIDTTVRDQRQAEADRADNSQARADRLQARAERHAVAADTLADRADQISGFIPFGQPILAGHHSERRHVRDVERLRRYTSSSIEEARLAEDAQRRSAIAAAATDVRNGPQLVANRIDRLAAIVKAAERNGTLDRVAHEAAQLEYWQEVRQEQQAAGVAQEFSAETIRPGDHVSHTKSGTLYRVVRANKTTVTVAYDLREGVTSTGRIKYHQIRRHIPAT